MKWFDKWFAKKCQQAWTDAETGALEEAKMASSMKVNLARPHRGLTVKHDDGLHSRGTNFTMYNANGGTVVELRDYDPMSDRHHTVLYVIPKELDLGQQLGHIVTMEALKR